MDGGGDEGKEGMSEEEYLREFLKNLQLTKDWLRKRYGDRLLDMMGFDDFLQEAAITIWRNRSDPKFMRRKAGFQQKTFYQKKFYRKERTVPMSVLESPNSDLSSGRERKIEDTLFIDRREQPFVVIDEDWETLRIRHNLRDIDVTMLRMRCDGCTAEEIAKVAGIAPNSVHVRISDIKRKIMETHRKGGCP